jgi:transcriptional regulator with XRE-family HTH domain
MTVVIEAGARHLGRRRIDWREAAQLLAHGLTLSAVSRRVGCSRSQLSRKRNSDPVFQRWVAEFAATISERQHDPIADLRRTLHEAIEAEVRNGNVRVILWLADRLKLVTPPSERTPEQELRDILRGLSPDEVCEFEGLRDTA